jgi:hypothetical protein
VWGFDDRENDPRGVLGAASAAWSLDPREHDQPAGEPVALCAECGGDGTQHQRALLCARRVWEDAAASAGRSRRSRTLVSHRMPLRRSRRRAMPLPTRRPRRTCAGGTGIPPARRSRLTVVSRRAGQVACLAGHQRVRQQPAHGTTQPVTANTENCGDHVVGSAYWPQRYAAALSPPLHDPTHRAAGRGGRSRKGSPRSVGAVPARRPERDQPTDPHGGPDRAPDGNGASRPPDARRDADRWLLARVDQRRGPPFAHHGVVVQPSTTTASDPVRSSCAARRLFGPRSKRHR